MKVQVFILGLFLSVFSACISPTASDFVGKNAPLSESELLITWRVPLVPNYIEVIDTSAAHAEEILLKMEPFREQFIPRIFEDLSNGELVLYQVEGPESIGRQEPSDFFDAMNRMPSGSMDDLTVFSSLIHITQRRHFSQKDFDAIELGLELRWSNFSDTLSETLPERSLGQVMFSDLDSLGYGIIVDGKEIGIVEFVEENREFIFPINLYTLEEKERGIFTLEAAFGVKEYLLNGKWDEIQWLGMEPNLTDYSVQDRPEEEMNSIIGEYIFTARQDHKFTEGGESIVVNVDVIDQVLWTRWSNKHQYFAYLIYPTENDKYFSSTGDIISFQATETGGKRMIILTPDGDTITGESN